MWCAPARVNGIKFQACSFNHSDISPFRINNLQHRLKDDCGDCDKSSNVPRSLTGFSSIAAPLLVARRNDHAASVLRTNSAVERNQFTEYPSR